MGGFAKHFSRFLESDLERIHFAAHSHHPWPDVTYAAQQQAWVDAATHHDDKWQEVVHARVMPEARRHIAGVLGLPDPASIATAASTHELLLRLLSCLPRPVRVLTTDSEFHSFSRQVRRLEEERLAHVERVHAEPFATFPERFAAAAGRGGHHLVFASHVHFNSAYVTPDLAAVCAAVPDDDTFVVIDGYHGFMALPTDLSAVAGRAFYLAGGYKYAMAGEGACFLHCPPGYGERPVDTGWFATFGELTAPSGDRVLYPPDGGRFMGSTFDPTAWYRFNAVQDWLAAEGVTVAAIHRHVRTLQEGFLARLDSLGLGGLTRAAVVPSTTEVPDRGHFLTFRLDRAGDVCLRLHDARVITDHRGDRLRLGFGVYHDEDTLDRLADRLAAALR
jgi:kynureninase